MKLVTMSKMRLSYLRALDDQSLLLTKLQLKTKLRVTNSYWQGQCIRDEPLQQKFFLM